MGPGWVQGWVPGWPCREGAHDFEPEKCSVEDDLTDPVFDHSQESGNESITGGQVYTGSALPGLQGKYLFSDFVSGRVFALDEQADGKYKKELILNTSQLISDLAESSDGEAYLLDYITGQISKLIPGDGESKNTIVQLPLIQL